MCETAQRPSHSVFPNCCKGFGIVLPKICWCDSRESRCCWRALQHCRSVAAWGDGYRAGVCSDGLGEQVLTGPLAALDKPQFAQIDSTSQCGKASLPLRDSLGLFLHNPSCPSTAPSHPRHGTKLAHQLGVNIDGSGAGRKQSNSGDDVSGAWGEGRAASTSFQNPILDCEIHRLGLDRGLHGWTSVLAERLRPCSPQHEIHTSEHV